MSRNKMVYRGDIYYMSFEYETTNGNEQGGFRPVLIIQNDVGNEFSGNVIVATVTSRDKKDLPTHTVVEPSSHNGLEKTSIVLLEQIKTVSKDRLGSYCGRLPDTDMERVDVALAVSIGLSHSTREEFEARVREVAEQRVKQEMRGMKVGSDFGIDDIIEEEVAKKLEVRGKTIEEEIEKRVQIRLKEIEDQQKENVSEITTSVGTVLDYKTVPMSVSQTIVDNISDFIENLKEISLIPYQKDMIRDFLSGKIVYTERRMGRSLILDGISTYFKTLDMFNTSEAMADVCYDNTLLFQEVFKLRGDGVCPGSEPVVDGESDTNTKRVYSSKGSKKTKKSENVSTNLFEVFTPVKRGRSRTKTSHTASESESVLC
jgi:mRNA interferase MazF